MLIDGKILQPLQELRLAAYVLGFECSPLSHESLMKGLSAVIKVFPDLSVRDYDKEKHVYRLMNEEQDHSKQNYLSVAEAGVIEFGWGLDVEMHMQPQLESFLESLQSGFDLLSVAVQAMDLRLVAICEWRGNHYAAIADAFLSGGPLGDLFQAPATLSNDLVLRGMIDESRVAIVRIASDVEDSEIRSGKYGADLLRVQAGVGLVRHINVDMTITRIFESHASKALDFMQQKFIPHVLLPLDKSIVAMKLASKNGDGAHGD